MNVIGLDLSLACSGIAFGNGETDHFRTDPKRSRCERAVATRDWIRDYLAPGADLVVIEAIATIYVDTAIALAYVHAHIDHLLRDHQVVKVAPTVLKKWATGRGTASKHDMTVAAMRNGWSSEGSTDDECDSWWLYTLGMALCDVWTVPATEYRQTIVATLTEAL